MKEIKLCIIGITGRMGRELMAAVQRRADAGENIRVLAGIAEDKDPFIGERMPSVELPISSSWETKYNQSDIIIDFSSPAGALLAAESAIKAKKPLLECSTGLNAEEEKIVFDASKHVPLLRTRNTSLGINVLCKLVNDATRMLGESFEIELVEIHHRYKKDAPSGTALMLLEEAAKARNTDLRDVINLGRSGVGLSRPSQEIGAQAVRGGDVAGDHTVFFLADGERLELTHRATGAKTFAEGAIRAAIWLADSNREKGAYNMLDVLED